MYDCSRFRRVVMMEHRGRSADDPNSPNNESTSPITKSSPVMSIYFLRSVGFGQCARQLMRESHQPTKGKAHRALLTGCGIWHAGGTERTDNHGSCVRRAFLASCCLVQYARLPLS